MGLGYYVYALNTEAPKPKAPAVATTSALDKDSFVEFPLLKKESYNHNTTKYEHLVLLTLVDDMTSYMLQQTRFTFKLPDNTGYDMATLCLLHANWIIQDTTSSCGIGSR